jgi:8-oxo-dGTP diphosphatase
VSADPRPLTAVAAAVFERDGRFMLARRPAGKVYAGFWEFPGGKIEAGEDAAAALRREIEEELGVRVIDVAPWITREFSYPHARVRLHFFRVGTWLGELSAREHEALAWWRPGETAVAPMLPANAPVLKSLALPALVGLSAAGELGTPEFLRRAAVALDGGLRMIVLREPNLAQAAQHELADALRALCDEHGARLIVHNDLDLARACHADGVHLPARVVATAKTRPECEWVGASCHDAAEIAAALALGADYLFLGSVLPSASHPGVTPLGWERFAALSANTPVPIFAIGGMDTELLPLARRNGAHGLAMLRAAWRGVA